MKIYIKDLCSRKYLFNVNSSWKVQHLKQAYKDLMGVPLYQQRLIYKSSQLQVQKTLGDYGIKDGDVVYVVLRIRGC